MSGNEQDYNSGIVISRACPPNCAGVGAKNSTPYLEIDCASCRKQMEASYRAITTKPEDYSKIREDVAQEIKERLENLIRTTSSELVPELLIDEKDWQVFWKEYGL